MVLILLVYLAVAVVGFLGVILSALGFTPIGIAVGSLAAIVQAIIGNVVAGSVFAAVQSFAAVFWGRVFGIPGLTVAFIFILALWKGYLW